MKLIEEYPGQVMDFVADYSEPDYDKDGNGLVVLGNWNGETGKRLAEILEMRYDCTLEWFDEWDRCCHCGNAVRTCADSYQWQPSFVVLGECDLVCRNCMAEDESWQSEYLEERNGEWISVDFIDLENHDFVRVVEGQETGFHQGQTADPKHYINLFQGAGIERFVFSLDENSQFYGVWSVWVDAGEADKAREILNKEQVK